MKSVPYWSVLYDSPARRARLSHSSPPSPPPSPYSTVVPLASPGLLERFYEYEYSYRTKI